MGRGPFLGLERDFVEAAALRPGWVVHEETRSHTKRGRCAAASSRWHRAAAPRYLPLRVGAQRPSCVFVDESAFQAEPGPLAIHGDGKRPAGLPEKGVNRGLVESQRFDRVVIHEVTRRHTKRGHWAAASSASA